MVTGADRCHWLRHDENMAARDMWAQDLMATFKEDVKKVRDAFTSSSQSSPRVEQKPPPPLPEQNNTPPTMNTSKPGIDVI